MPVYDRMYTHEARPTMIRGIEMLQVFTMWVCAAGADEYGLDGRIVAQVRFECYLHGTAVGGESKAIGMARLGDKLLDFRERMRGLDVHSLDGLRKRGSGGHAATVKGTEVQDEENEAVFAAVVG